MFRPDRESDTVMAETIYGKVRGLNFDGVNIFKGIPYGGNTSGFFRFLPPSKPDRWKGIKDCTINGPRCIQYPGNIFTSPLLGKYFSGGRSDAAELTSQDDSENCLNLNVLTKDLKGKKPVMVYIHGGGFSAGSDVLTVLSDRFVMEQDVVLVGINHRLNVFGYTYLGGIDEKYAYGNAGQLDIIKALKWVQANISGFGGDPQNVMLFGESGGGAKISALLAMPGAKGLFHKAAIQSGSMLKVTSAEDATLAARNMMSRLGITKVDDLLKVPAGDLLKASSGRLMAEGPVIDGKTLKRHPWYPDAPGISAGIPLLIGNDKDESTLFSGIDEIYSLDKAGLKAQLIKEKIPEDKVDKLLEIYSRNYPGESPYDLYFRISTDRGARYNAEKLAELQLSGGKANVFVYYCQYNSPLYDGKLRSFHTCDLPLTMRLTLFPETEQLSRLLSAAWAAFARTGDPGTDDLPWKEYTADQRATMVFDADKSGIVNDPNREARIFLKDMPSNSFL